MIFLEYAETSRGLIHVDDVTTLTTICPYCGEAVIPKRGDCLTHHFAHRSGTSCRPVTTVASRPPVVACYQSLWLSLTPQQRAVLVRWYQAHGRNSAVFRGEKNSVAQMMFQAIGQRYRKTLEMFLDRGFLTVEEDDDLFVVDPTYALTDLGLALNGALPCAQFVRVIEQEQARQASSDVDPVTLRILQYHRERLRGLSLYLMQIAIDGCPYIKIGVTGRDVDVRLSEVMSMTKADAGQVLGVWDGRGVLESYVKARFKPFQAELGNFTEFFRFEAKRRIWDELKAVPPVRIPAAERQNTNNAVPVTA